MTYRLPFLTEEFTGTGGVIKMRDEDFLADGVIRLEKERVSATDTQRYLVVDKMRATRHNTNYFAMMYENNRFQISMALNKTDF